MTIRILQELSPLIPFNERGKKPALYNPTEQRILRKTPAIKTDA